MRLPLIIAVLAYSTTSVDAAEERPNVLFIAIDDLNDWIGVFGGHPLSQTPCLDRFLNSGAVAFRNAHCPGPVCGPSRSAILSGFWPSRSGIYGNSSNMLDSPLVQKHATMPEYFSRHGYHTLSMGKISHAHVRDSGWDSGQWMFDVWEPANGNSAVIPETLTSRDRNLIRGQPGPETSYSKPGGSEFAYGVTIAKTKQTKDYKTAAWAAEQLQQTFDKPFFLAVGLSKPHLPFFSPQEFWDLYPEDQNYAPEIRQDDLDDITTPDGKPYAKPSLDYLWLQQNGLINECARAYLACTSYADHCLGVIFDALERSPHFENTIVVVWGDHGWHLGEKLRYRKATLWTESTRAPLIVRLPGMTESTHCKRPVNLIDLYPTLVDLCNLPEKTNIDGQSFVPLLFNPQQKWFPTITIAGPQNVSVHDDRWNFVSHRDGTMELYDLLTDPMEWKNLADTPTFKTISEQLKDTQPNSYAAPVPASPTMANKRTAKEFDRMIRQQRLSLDLK